MHIAGTNGKGSVALKTANALAYCGYTTGLYTSPHISSFTERIQILGDKQQGIFSFLNHNVHIDEKDFVDRYNEVVNVIIKHRLDITFFEVLTMMAYLEFREKKVDYAVLEVGIGGRLDATNSCTNVACTAITSIGMDH